MRASLIDVFKLLRDFENVDTYSIIGFFRWLEMVSRGAEFQIVQKDYVEMLDGEAPVCKQGLLGVKHVVCWNCLCRDDGECWVQSRSPSEECIYLFYLAILPC